MMQPKLFLSLCTREKPSPANYFFTEKGIEKKVAHQKICLDAYLYGFNGKLKDNEWAGVGNHLDYGARGLDTRTGRWIAKDPLAIKYPFASSYNFALDNPIWAKDPDGKVVVFINGQNTGDGGKPDYWRIYSDVKVGQRSEKDGFGRWHTSDVYQKQEMYAFDKAAMNKIGDHKAIYRDGSSGGWLNTIFTNSNLSEEAREDNGYKKGTTDAKELISHLSRDKDGNINETIKIVSHSMGGAYAKGWGQGVLDFAQKNNIKGVKIEFEVDFDPFQPGSQKSIPGVKTIQVSHKYDNVTNNMLMPHKAIEGAEQHYSDDPNKGHSIFDSKDETNYIPQSSQNGNQGTPTTKTPTTN